MKNSILAAGILSATLMAGVANIAAAQETSVTILRLAEAERYDPQRIASRAMNEAMFLMADTLVALDFDMQNVSPLLAESWDISEDGLTYTFHLKDGVKFCDGRDLVADDVVYSFDRWREPESPKASAAGKVKSITAPDDLTVVYELEEPYSELLLQLTQVPASIIDRANVEELGQDFGVKGFNGTGPYCWGSWTPRNEMVLTRNPDYVWGSAIYDNTGPAKEDKLVLKQIPEEATRLAAMMSNQGDITQFVPRWSIDQLEAAPNVNVSASDPYFSILFMGFKTDRPLVSDPRVREAMNLAIDRDEIARSIFFGKSDPAYTYTRPESKDFNEDLMENAPYLDLDRARALLDEAGWALGDDGFRYKDGEKLAPAMVIPAAIMTDVGQAVQGALREIGVDAKVELLDSAAFFSRLRQPDYEIYGLQQPYLTSGTMLTDNFTSAAIPSPNRMNWSNEEFDRLVAAGNRAVNDEERKEAYFAAQKLVHDDYVWMPLVHDKAFLVTGSKVKPMRAHGNQGLALYKGLDIELAQ